MPNKMCNVFIRQKLNTFTRVAHQDTLVTHRIDKLCRLQQYVAPHPAMRLDHTQYRTGLSNLIHSFSASEYGIGGLMPFSLHPSRSIHSMWISQSRPRSRTYGVNASSRSATTWASTSGVIEGSLLSLARCWDTMRTNRPSVGFPPTYLQICRLLASE